MIEPGYPDVRELGTRLEAQRKYKNWSLDVLAEHIAATDVRGGEAPSTVYLRGVESGSRLLGPGLLRAWMRVLGWQVDDSKASRVKAVTQDATLTILFGKIARSAAMLKSFNRAWSDHKWIPIELPPGKSRVVLDTLERMLKQAEAPQRVIWLVEQRGRARSIMEAARHSTSTAQETNPITLRQAARYAGALRWRLAVGSEEDLAFALQITNWMDSYPPRSTFALLEGPLGLVEQSGWVERLTRSLAGSGALLADARYVQQFFPDAQPPSGMFGTSFAAVQGTTATSAVPETRPGQPPGSNLGPLLGVGIAGIHGSGGAGPASISQDSNAGHRSLEDLHALLKSLNGQRVREAAHYMADQLDPAARDNAFAVLKYIAGRSES